MYNEDGIHKGKLVGKTINFRKYHLRYWYHGYYFSSGKTAYTYNYSDKFMQFKYNIKNKKLWTIRVLCGTVFTKGKYIIPITFITVFLALAVMMVSTVLLKLVEEGLK